MAEVCGYEVISVAIRLRPLNRREEAGKEVKIFGANGSSVVLTKDGTCCETQYYDKVFSEEVKNSSVYEHMAQNIV